MGAADWLRRKKKKAEEALFLPEQTFLLNWAQTWFLPGESVLVNMNSHAEVFVRTQSNWKRKSSRYRQLEKKEPCRIIMCEPGRFSEHLRNSVTDDRKSKEQWIAIFSSENLEIYEWREYYRGRSLPLRFGFSKAEKLQMLRYVRKTMEESLGSAENGTPIAEEAFPERFRESISLDIALWVKGTLRSSVIIQDVALSEGLRLAAVKAPFDGRFKPVSLDEMSTARIEVTLMHDFRMPMTASDLRGRIDTIKGYRVKFGNQSGWYLPEVFNCVRFSDPLDFFGTLAENKAGIPRKYLAEVKLEMFEVVDFIEAPDDHGVLSLSGPIAQLHAPSAHYDRAFCERLEACVKHASDFLLGMQEEDGNIIPEYDPLTAKIKQIDWIRQALAAGALIMAGKYAGRQPLSDAGERALLYMDKAFFSHPSTALTVRTAASVYYAKSKLLLGDKARAQKIAHDVLQNKGEVPYAPISYLQMASLFISLESEDPELLKEGEEMLERAFRDYSRRIECHEKFQLAYFPEMINVLLKRHSQTGSEHYRVRAREVTDWLVKQQLSDGGFPIVPGSSFVYTRGTGKIFEVLTLEPERNKAAILSVLAWLENMQYTDQNSYFIDPSRRGTISGGFRNDALNQAVWSDAAAHIIIGGTRLLSCLKTGKENRDF